MIPARTPYFINVDLRKTVSLNFGTTRVSIEPWERSSVKVSPNEYFTRYVEVLREYNMILFDFDSYLEENPFTNEGVGFEVKAPRESILSVTAGECVVRGCTVTTVQSTTLVLRDCLLGDDFRFDGELFTAQGCRFDTQARLTASSIRLKHCGCERVVLSPQRSSSRMSISFRNVRAGEIRLETDIERVLTARLHHVHIKELAIEGAFREGSVIIEGGRISRVRNDTLIPVVRGIRKKPLACA
jgi:hypothetical protein